MLRAVATTKFATTVRDSTFKSARNTGVNLNQPKLILLECPYPVIPTQHIIHMLLNQNTAFLGTRLATQFFHPSKASDVVIWRLRNSAEQNSQTTRDVPIPQQPNSQALRPTQLVIPLRGLGCFETNPNPGRVNSSSLLEETGVVPRHHPLIGITSIQTLYHTHNWCLSFFSPKEQRISLAIQESWITPPNMGLRNPQNSQVIQESWIASQSRRSCTAKKPSDPGILDHYPISTFTPLLHSQVIQESWIADFFVLPLQTPPNSRVIQEFWITFRSRLHASPTQPSDPGILDRSPNSTFMHHQHSRVIQESWIAPQSSLSCTSNTAE